MGPGLCKSRCPLRVSKNIWPLGQRFIPVRSCQEKILYWILPNPFTYAIVFPSGWVPSSVQIPDRAFSSSLQMLERRIELARDSPEENGALEGLTILHQRQVLSLEETRQPAVPASLVYSFQTCGILGLLAVTSRRLTEFCAAQSCRPPSPLPGRSFMQAAGRVPPPALRARPATPG